jgi:hypothetical protein
VQDDILRHIIVSHQHDPERIAVAIENLWNGSISFFVFSLKFCCIEHVAIESSSAWVSKSKNKRVAAIHPSGLKPAIALNRVKAREVDKKHLNSRFNEYQPKMGKGIRAEKNAVTAVPETKTSIPNQMLSDSAWDAKSNLAQKLKEQQLRRLPLPDFEVKLAD